MTHSRPVLALLAVVTALVFSAMARADDAAAGVSSASRSSFASSGLRSSHASLALNAESIGGELGFGAGVTSPLILGAALGLRLSVSEFANHGSQFAQQTDNTLNPYTLFRLGPVIAYPLLREQFRLSASFGVAYATQSQRYSSGLVLKGYFAAEFEYLPRAMPDLGVYLGLGAMQASNADLFSPTLAYGGGIDATVGLRHYF